MVRMANLTFRFIPKRPEQILMKFEINNYIVGGIWPDTQMKMAL